MTFATQKVEEEKEGGTEKGALFLPFMIKSLGLEGSLAHRPQRCGGEKE